MILGYTLNYILVGGLCFLCAGWMIVVVLSEKINAVDDDTNDGFGGLPDGIRFPIFDPPGGCHLDDLLVDRMPVMDASTPERGELTAMNRRGRVQAARSHPASADPVEGAANWGSKKRFFY